VDAALTTVTLSLPANASAVGGARHAVSRHPALAPGLRDDLALITSELVANAVMHGGYTAEDEVRVRAVYGEDWARVIVQDGGGGFDPATAPRRDEGGYGLLIVEALAGRWGIAPGLVWAELATRAV
jgi:anti-sigma regulatory factor (Ser/Thr protein kinase)